MFPIDRPLQLATHSDTFHADDCLAYVILIGALGLNLHNGTHVLLRTRDTSTLDAANEAR
jgi:uncharacterized UPF0160 family protein